MESMVEKNKKKFARLNYARFAVHTLTPDSIRGPLKIKVDDEPVILHIIEETSSLVECSDEKCLTSKSASEDIPSFSISAVADSVKDVAAGDKANRTDKNPNMGAEQMSSNIKKGSMAAEDPGGINDNNDEEWHKFEIIGQFQEKADPIVGGIKYHPSSYDVEEREKCGRPTSER
ncbi:hypothetical protein Ancab_025776 [Ancistrocladus abbreviatus]